MSLESELPLAQGWPRGDVPDSEIGDEIGRHAKLVALCAELRVHCEDLAVDVVDALDHVLEASTTRVLDAMAQSGPEAT